MTPPPSRTDKQHETLLSPTISEIDNALGSARGRGAARNRAGDPSRDATTGKSGRDTGQAVAGSKGTGKDSSGKGQDSAGTGQDSVGTGQDSAGTGQDSAGTGQDSAGTGKDSAGTGKDSAGTGKDSAGTGQDSAGKGQDSAGTGKDSAGTGKDSAGTESSGGRTEGLGGVDSDGNPLTYDEAGGKRKGTGSSSDADHRGGADGDDDASVTDEEEEEEEEEDGDDDGEGEFDENGVRIKMGRNDRDPSDGSNEGKQSKRKRRLNAEGDEEGGDDSSVDGFGRGKTGGGKLGRRGGGDKKADNKGVAFAITAHVPEYVKQVPWILKNMEDRCTERSKRPIPYIPFDEGPTKEAVKEYLTRHKIKEIFDTFLSALLTERPDNPVDFLHELAVVMNQQRGASQHADDKTAGPCPCDGPTTTTKTTKTTKITTTTTTQTRERLLLLHEKLKTPTTAAVTPRPTTNV